MAIDQLFFELLRVAIGNKECLSHVPSSMEWKELYEMAKRQSLMGVCFAGVQRLNSSNPSNTSNLSEPQYLTWMGMAAKIQRRNEVMNRQCAELQNRLSECGIRSCILKGQGVGALYREGLSGSNGLSGLKGLRSSSGSNGSNGDSQTSLNSSNTSNLSMLRQSGDIDIYVGHEAYGKACELLSGYSNTGVSSVTDKHSEMEIDGTLVEVHRQTMSLMWPRQNKLFQRLTERYLLKSDEQVLLDGVHCVMLPDVQYNVVYVFLHMWEHFKGRGVGLRQVMDWMFVLRNADGRFDRGQLHCDLMDLGLLKAWKIFECLVVRYFGFDRSLCPEYDERYMGSADVALSIIMDEGNFGRDGSLVKDAPKGLLARKLHSLRYATMRFVKLARVYPALFPECMLAMVYKSIIKKILK